MKKQGIRKVTKLLRRTYVRCKATVILPGTAIPNMVDLKILSIVLDGGSTHLPGEQRESTICMRES